MGSLSDRERDSEYSSDDRVESFMRVMAELGIDDIRDIRDIPEGCNVLEENRDVWVIKG